jgi:hypothetical protein
VYRIDAKVIIYARVLRGMIAGAEGVFVGTRER